MRVLVFTLLMTAPAMAETLVAAHTIRARQIVTAEDLKIVSADTPGTLSDPADAIGLETREIIYANRPLRSSSLGPPALVDRNQIVPVSFTAHGLRIITEGRALGRAGAGETVRVMNLDLRTTITGQVTTDGRIVVGPRP